MVIDNWGPEARENGLEDNLNQKRHLSKTIIVELLNQNQLYNTARISLVNVHYLENNMQSKNYLAKRVVQIMTPNVTKTLPDNWQSLKLQRQVDNWIRERKKDSNFFAIWLKESKEVIGFLFLYDVTVPNKSTELRLGYLLEEGCWGKGIGSELIAGLVKWAQASNLVSAIVGGVEKENIGSIKVLQKNGFYLTKEEKQEDMLFYKIDFNLQ